MIDDDAALLERWRARWAEPVSGWDPGGPAGAVRSGVPPWDYTALARQALAAAGPDAAVVDLGTGGGEWLLGVADALPADTSATEGWPPNLPVARAALAPLGIGVVEYDADRGDRLPLPEDRVDLVLCRHEAYDPGELRRVLRPGGTVLTQQVDGQNLADLAAVFGGGPAYPEITLGPLRSGLAAAGLDVDLAREWSGSVTFADVDALVGFLRWMPWQLPEGWSVDGHADALLGLHARAAAGEPLRLTLGTLVLRARLSP